MRLRGSAIMRKFLCGMRSCTSDLQCTRTFAGTVTSHGSYDHSLEKIIAVMGDHRSIISSLDRLVKYDDHVLIFVPTSTLIP